MKLYPLFLSFAKNTKVTRGQLIKATGLNPVTVNLLIDGGKITVEEEFIQKLDEINSNLEGAVFLYGTPFEI